MSDDDMTFALTLIDYSIKKLFDDGASVVAPVALLTSVFGRKKAEQTTEAYERLMEAIVSGKITGGSIAKAAVFHLSAMQGLMDKIITESADKAAMLAEIAKVEAAYPPKGLSAVIAGLGKEVIDSAKAEIAAMP